MGGFVVGIFCVGVHMGMTQGSLKAIIASYTKASLRGAAFSVFNFMCGLGILFSNILAGYVADVYGLKYIFLIGVLFSFLSCFGLMLLIAYERKNKISYSSL